MPDVSDKCACVPPDIQRELLIFALPMLEFAKQHLTKQELRSSNWPDLWMHGYLGAHGKSDMDRNTEEPFPGFSLERHRIHSQNCVCSAVSNMAWAKSILHTLYSQASLRM